MHFFVVWLFFSKDTPLRTTFGQMWSDAEAIGHYACLLIVSLGAPGVKGGRYQGTGRVMLKSNTFTLTQSVA